MKFDPLKMPRCRVIEIPVHERQGENEDNLFMKKAF